MLAWRARGRVWQRARRRSCSLVEEALGSDWKPANAFKALGARHASPQPAPCESSSEEGVHTHPEQQLPTQYRSTETREARKWDRFVYTMYHLRAKVSEESIAASAALGMEASAEDAHVTQLLPIMLLLDPKTRQGFPLSEWTRQLQNEIDCYALTRQKLEKKIEDILERGAMTELRSAHAVIKHLERPMVEAIIREQRSILQGESRLDRRGYGPFLLLAPAHVLAHITLHKIMSASLSSGQLGLATLTKTAIEIGYGLKLHVEAELVKAKAQRLRSQHARLQKRLKSKDVQPSSYKEWIQEFGLPLDDEPRRRESESELMESLMSLRAFDLPDPAKLRPQDPLSDVAIISYSRKDIEKVTKKENCWVSEQEGMLDVVRTSAKPKRGMTDYYKKRRDDQLQEKLNRLLESAKHWSTEKEAKVGARLVDLAMQTLKVRQRNRETGIWETVPLLEHHMINDDSLASLRIPRVTGMVRIHDSVVNQIVQLTDIIYLQETVFDPMVVPPLPWRGVFFGGQLLQNDTVVRVKSSKAQMEALRRRDREGPGLSKVYDSLNSLQAVPWRINKPILEVARAIHISGEVVCGFPAREHSPIIPRKHRHRFMTWMGGHVEDAAVATRDTQAAETALMDAVKSMSFWQKDMKPNEAKVSFRAKRLDLPTEGVEPMARMEPNIPALLSDSDEGSELWRHRIRGNKKRFCRTQLLATSSPGETLKELKVRRMQNSDIRKRNREKYAQLCDLAIKMAVAESYKNEERIFYPHNLDFRGRAYTLHGHLTHLGSDICRGILQFADSRPLGEEGLDWLFVQLTNCWGWGEDKQSFEGRREFALKSIYDILESAAAPLEHKWWQGAEDPFQVLAVAMDIKAAIESGDPASYKSCIPVAMDGSCNGLQHYAALALDLRGGASVNMTNANKPQDVYAEVARLVKQSAKLDAVNGMDIPQKLLPYFNRRLVKQTVMTSVYGVTLLGAKAQIASRLREHGYSKRLADKAGMYAAHKTLNGLHQRFKEAMLVMAWLSSCARSIARTKNPVAWTTPLGLPVVQPYQNLPKVHLQTTLQRVILQNDSQVAAVNVGKQRTAFPPNFIHSMDSTHMLMTAAACTDAGLQFAGVHDSFWTHAQNVPVMNRILREQFIKLYSQPLLEELRDSFIEQYPTAEIPPLPSKGNLDLHSLLDATYFFS